MTGSYLTPAGEALSTLALLGEGVHITRVLAATGVWEVLPEEDAYELTDPLDITVILLDVALAGNRQIKIKAGLSNQSVEEPTTITSFGVYAYDPRYGEILYAVVRRDEQPLYLYPPQGNTYEEIEAVLYVAVSATPQVTFEIDHSIIFVTHPEFELRMTVHRHSAAAIDESTGETTEEAQRRQDAQLDTLAQGQGMAMVQRGFQSYELDFWIVEEGILTGDKLTTGGAA